jgi:hypothetical protein
MSQRKTNTERSSDLLQAFLDLFPHPAWISDAETPLMLNEAARAMVSQGFSLSSTKTRHGVISHRGKRFLVQQREMNHGTNCQFFELTDEDEPVNRMRALSERMSQVLDRCQV